jgi:hypothetical protein
MKEPSSSFTAETGEAKCSTPLAFLPEMNEKKSEEIEPVALPNQQSELVSFDLNFSAIFFCSVEERS